MVDFHGLGVDVRFEGIERVRQRGHCECHGFFLRVWIWICFVSEQKAWHGTACSNQSCANDAGPSNKLSAVDGNLQRRGARRRACGLYRYTADEGNLHANGDKTKFAGMAFVFHWMRESAQRADSAMTASCEAERR